MLHSKQTYKDIYCLKSLGMKNSFGYALEYDKEPINYSDEIGYRFTLSYYKN